MELILGVLFLSILTWLLGIAAIIKGSLLLFGYLNNQVFPQPLDSEEEQHYLELWQKGNYKARDKLIEHNLRLVAHVVKKYESSGEEMDDLISIGTIGLIKGINTFNNRHGVKLATYAARCIDNEVLMHLRNLKKVKQEVFMYDPIGYDKEGNEISLIDLLTSDNDIVEQVDYKLQKEKIQAQLKSLDPREKKVIEMRYGLYTGIRETQRDIARKLGISRSYVSRIEKRALKKLISILN
jgi:RNA polymerase sporulation-specific sigma factor